MNAEQQRQHDDVLRLTAAGLPWGQILQWIIQFGLPLLLQILPLILPFLAAHAGKSGKLKTADRQRLRDWMQAALEAAHNGADAPPPPE